MDMSRLHVSQIKLLTGGTSLETGGISVRPIEAALQVSRFPGFKASRFPGFQVFRFPGFQVSRFPGMLLRSAHTCDPQSKGQSSAASWQTQAESELLAPPNVSAFTGMVNGKNFPRGFQARSMWLLSLFQSQPAHTHTHKLCKLLMTHKPAGLAASLPKNNQRDDGQRQ